MYILYSSENSYSMTAQVMLEELGLDYELRWVTIHIPMEEKDPEWLQYNPNGRVPTLLSPEGALYETGAILVSLAEKYPDAGLIPPLSDPKRPLYWQWHFYLISSMQPEEIIQDGPDRYFPDGERQEALKTASMAHLRLVWRVLDEALAVGPYLLGDRFTSCDISFAMQACWKECQPPEGLSHYPHARSSLRKVLARPAVRRVLEIHKVAEQADI